MQSVALWKRLTVFYCENVVSGFIVGVQASSD